MGADIPCEPRAAVAVLARAGLAGVVGGGLLGALALLPDLVSEWRETDPEVGRSVEPTSLVFAAAVGALVGLAAALAAAVGWLLTVEGPPPRPRLSRLVAGAASAAIIMAIALVLGAAGNWFTAGCGLVGGLLAIALAPRIGYRYPVRDARSAMPDRSQTR